MRVEDRKFHWWTKIRTASERLQSWAPFIFSFYTLKPRSGADNQEKFCRSIHGSQKVEGQALPTVLAVFPGLSAPSSKGSQAWQMGSTSGALSGLLINQYISI